MSYLETWGDLAARAAHHEQSIVRLIKPKGQIANSNPLLWLIQGPYPYAI